jgi:FtsH-binding integral membrane protein
MTPVILIIVLLTTLWVGYDAEGRNWSSDGFANRPWKWIVGCLLLWIVVFPLYLMRRGRTTHQPVQTRRSGPVFWWGIASSVAMAIGAFGPWATVLGMTLSGVHARTDGRLIVGLAIVGVLCTLAGRSLALLTTLTGIAGLGIGLYDRHNIDSAIGQAGPFLSAVASVGWGLDLVLLASASLAIQGVIAGIQTAQTTSTATTYRSDAISGATPPLRVAYATSAPTAFSASKPAGWYPDPYDELRLRYWTGNDWSARTAELNSGTV